MEQAGNGQCDAHCQPCFWVLVPFFFFFFAADEAEAGDCRSIPVS